MFWEILATFFNSRELLLGSLGITCVLKSILLATLFPYISNSKISIKSILYLVLILASAVFVDCFLFLNAANTRFLSSEALCYIAHCARTANIIFPLSLALFIQDLARIKNHIFAISLFFCGGILAFFHFIEAYSSKFLNVPLIQIDFIFFLAMGAFTLFQALSVIYRPKNRPALLTHQLKIFTFWLLIPFFLLKALINNLFIPFLSGILPNNALISLNTVFLTWAMYYCAFKLIGLRFLNAKDHISTTKRFNFVEHFKKAIERMGQATTTIELKHLTQQFFHQTFAIPDSLTHLIIFQDTYCDQGERKINLLPESPLDNLLRHTKIITRDEIEFSAFYEQKAVYQIAADFLVHLEADIFIPIYSKQQFIGCIIIDRHSRLKNFFSGAEQDEMAVFAAYLASVINLVKNRSLDSILAKEKMLTEELHLKQEELNQYRESIRSFLRVSQEQKSGVIFYRQCKFTFANQAAHSFVPFDPNLHQGHPLAQALKQVARNTEKYKTSQTITTLPDQNNRRITITALPSLENQGLILILNFPEATDLIKLQTNLLKDPSKWDYLLYLESTQAGTLINKFFPSTLETSVNAKIDLLRASLHRSCTYLTAPTEDLPDLTNLFFTLSQRKQLHLMKLKEPEKQLAQGILLFGLSQLFQAEKETPPLLEQLDKTGLLYIENIQFLSLETQTYLAEFLRYGAFRSIKDEQRTVSDVRIICSSTANLELLVNEGKFSGELWHELRRCTVNFPSVSLLPKEEFDELTLGICHQALPSEPLKRMLALTERERALLFEKKVNSLHELRHALNTLLTHKSTQSEVKITPATLPTLDNQHDEELINRAILMGKKSLQDKETMTFLWKKFQNQAKIATLLGVNRSSVNRRCQQFGLL